VLVEFLIEIASPPIKSKEPRYLDTSNSSKCTV